MPRSHHAAKPPAPCPWADHPGKPLPITLAELADLTPLEFSTSSTPSRPCTICGRHIFQGDTIFFPDRDDEPGHVLCYECGSSLSVFFGDLTNAEAADLSPWAAARIPPSQPPAGG